MTHRYLIDASAMFRIHYGQASQKWVEASSQGKAATCDPVELEFLAQTRVAIRPAVKRYIRHSYGWVPAPDGAWSDAQRLQDALAERGPQAGPGVVDPLVAVTAERHGLTVLHDDNDYETISRVTGLPVQRITD